MDKKSLLTNDINKRRRSSLFPWHFLLENMLGCCTTHFHLGHESRMHEFSMWLGTKAAWVCASHVILLHAGTKTVITMKRNMSKLPVLQ